MWKGINLLKSSRMINFPFKVRSIGSTQMEFAHDLMRVFRTDHVEFCIRISSKEKFAHDQINGIRYRTRFPHLIVKMPFAQHCYQMKEPRNAVDFSYTLKDMENLRKLGLLPESPFTEFTMTPNLDLMLRQLPELMEHSQEYSIVDRIDLLCFHILEELFFIRKMSKTNEDPVERKRSGRSRPFSNCISWTKSAWTRSRNATGCPAAHFSVSGTDILKTLRHNIF